MSTLRMNLSQREAQELFSHMGAGLSPALTARLTAAGFKRRNADVGGPGPWELARPWKCHALPGAGFELTQDPDTAE